MKPSWTITAFAFAIVIAYGPNGSPTSCTALSIPVDLTNAISTAEIPNLLKAVFQSGGLGGSGPNAVVPFMNAIGKAVGVDLSDLPNHVITKLRGPLRGLSVTFVELARSILLDIEVPLKRWIKSVDTGLDRIEASLGASNEIEGRTTETTRHRRQLIPSFENPIDYFIDQVQLLIEKLENILVGVARQIKQTPGLVIDTLTSSFNVVTHPIEYLSNILNFIQRFSLDSLRAFLRSLTPMFLKFTTTQLVPFAHRSLNNIDKAGLLPAQLHAAVSTFNTMYDLSRMLGYVS
ncbi:uncharacterized protein LOC117229991 [Megalopta genalis]|uniref:uncharacterized protein LOC117229991 n=1 Tax=Megalopta genalis TaxID=115081 RepID=UPI003FD4B67C